MKSVLSFFLSPCTAFISPATLKHIHEISMLLFLCRATSWTTLSGVLRRPRNMWSRERTTSQNAKSSKRLANGWHNYLFFLFFSLFLPSPSLYFSFICYSSPVTCLHLYPLLLLLLPTHLASSLFFLSTCPPHLLCNQLLLGGNDRPHWIQCGALSRLCGEGGIRH